MEQTAEIFRTGTHKDMNGKSVSVDANALTQIVTQYNARATGTDAPLVIGHPATDTPAYGWVENLSHNGTSLFATFKDLTDGVRAMVQNRHYKKISVAFTRNADGKRALKHVGLLGATAPAVAGMADVVFYNVPENSPENEIFEYLTIKETKMTNTPTELTPETTIAEQQQLIDTQKAELAAKQEAFAKQQNTAQMENLSHIINRNDSLNPAAKKLVNEFAQSVLCRDENFAEADNAHQHLQTFVEKFAEAVSAGVADTKEITPNDGKADIESFSAAQLTAESQRIIAKGKQDGITIDAITATNTAVENLQGAA